jgi:hypothetical protein
LGAICIAGALVVVRPSNALGVADHGTTMGAFGRYRIRSELACGTLKMASPLGGDVGWERFVTGKRSLSAATSANRGDLA